MLPDLITPQYERLQVYFGLTAVVASEIEFYLHGAGVCAEPDRFWEMLTNACVKAGVPVFKYEKEQGAEQYEASLFPCMPLACAQHTAAFRDIAVKMAERFGMQADFSAKPLPDAPGSGLHIHVHLQDGEGKNVFFKKDDVISEELKHSIGGLLTWLAASMPVFAPHAESYSRFTAKSNAPTTVSWGANNRTVAIRLPDAMPDSKHIEHRVAGADADPHRVIALMLAAMHDGLTRRLEPGPQMYGDAALDMYALPKLPDTLAEAEAEMETFERMREYFDSSLRAA